MSSLLRSWVGVRRFGLVLFAVFGLLVGVLPVSVAEAAQAAGTFVGLAPVRVLDTREGVGAVKGPVGALGSVELRVTGRGGVPSSGVSAVVLNVTVTEARAGGYISVFPAGGKVPNVSNLNFDAGQTVPNLVTVKVGSAGRVSLRNGSPAGSVALVADVAGYYRSGTPSATGAFVALDPVRVLDTREGNGAGKQPVSASGTVSLQITGRGGVPSSGVSAVVVNVTATGAVAGGFVSVFPAGSRLPNVSNLNFDVGQTVPNLVVAKLGAGGKINLLNGSPDSAVHLIGDVAGYFKGTTPPAQLVNGNLQHKIDTGENHSCAVTAAGGVKCWGENGYGALGDGTTTRRSAPVNVKGLTSGVKAVATGKSHTCALTKAGGVKCWGDNSDGQLVDGTTERRIVPVAVSGLASGVTSISVGPDHSCAVTHVGGAKCWGSNVVGQLGDGSTTDSFVPTNVSGLTSGVHSISVGRGYSCALTTTGGVKCWGVNFYGQLGNGTTITRRTPTNVIGLTSGIAAISAGGWHVCALTKTGAVKCWGSNQDGHLGDGTTARRSTPINVKTLSAYVVAVDAGRWHTCALNSAGVPKCWGRNGDGQLGLPTFAHQTSPTDIVNLASGVSAIKGGGWHTCALTMAGGMKCWGNGSFGELGDGNIGYVQKTPVNVRGGNIFVRS